MNDKGHSALMSQQKIYSKLVNDEAYWTTLTCPGEAQKLITEQVEKGQQNVRWTLLRPYMCAPLAVKNKAAAKHEPGNLMARF